MCTVSFIPSGSDAIITSNRDEKLSRTTALAPKAYLHKTGFITYPKDAQAGGTWFALHQNGNAAVLLNGAFDKHKSEPPYRQSRGLVLLQIIDSESPLQTFFEILLTGIEPFTLVLWQTQLLHECRWDGKVKHHAQKNSHQPHIWSSATLYDVATRQKRENWFWQWLQQCPQPGQAQVMQFHHFGGDGNIENDLVMNRSNILRTVSIGSVEINSNKANLVYSDLVSNTQQHSEILFSTPTFIEYA